jgi:lysophospholipase L1-like esterase
MIPTRIICIGASSIQGRVDPKGGGWVGRLRKWHESNARHNVVYNLGIGGNTTRDLLKRLIPECKPRMPELIIFSLGLNDCRRIGSRNAPNDTPQSGYPLKIKKLIRQAKTLADVIFVGVYPIDDDKTTPIPWDNDKFYLLKDAEKYEALCKKAVLSQNIPYLDIWSDWVQKDYKKFLFEDGLHANNKGHEAIFQSVKIFLKELYSE